MITMKIRFRDYKYSCVVSDPEQKSLIVSRTANNASMLYDFIENTALGEFLVRNPDYALSTNSIKIIAPPDYEFIVDINKPLDKLKVMKVIQAALYKAAPKQADSQRKIANKEYSGKFLNDLALCIKTRIVELARKYMKYSFDHYDLKISYMTFLNIFSAYFGFPNYDALLVNLKVANVDDLLLHYIKAKPNLQYLEYTIEKFTKELTVEQQRDLIYHIQDETFNTVEIINQINGNAPALEKARENDIKKTMKKYPK
jgi:hypothetical protein